MVSRMPQYKPLEETSDSPDTIANPQVQLPSSTSQTPPQTFYPISRTVPPFHSTPRPTQPFHSTARPTPPFHPTARPTSLNYPIANTAQTLHSTASRTGPLYSTAPSTPPPFDPTARPIIIQPIQTELIIIIPVVFGKSPVRIQCPKCNTEQMTQTELKLGNGNWACFEFLIRIIGLLTLVLLFPVLLLPCACIALCMPSLMDVEHSCPNCNHILGTFEPVRDVRT